VRIRFVFLGSLPQNRQEGKPPSLIDLGLLPQTAALGLSREMTPARRTAGPPAEARYLIN